MPSHGRTRRMLGAARFGRRTLLATGAGAAAFIVACGNDRRRDDSGVDAAGASAAPTQSADDQPFAGGVLSQRIPSDASPSDLHLSTSISSIWPATPCFNQLIQFDPSKTTAGPQQIIPDLAERWEQPDPITLTFTLKQGVTFHDGSPLTALDPKVQLEWLLEPPEAKRSTRRSTMLAVESVETPDAATLRLRLRQPAPSLLINLASHPFAIGQAHDILANGGIGDQLIGTGPFRLSSEPGSSLIELERNRAYHVPDRPYLERLRFVVLSDYEAALENFIAGQYQQFYDPHFSIADHERVKLATAGRVETALVSSTVRDLIFINRRHRPFDDPRVRQAISLALDRDAAIKVIRDGAGRRGGYMSPNGAWAISEGDLKRYEGYDKPNIEKARQLLQQAGLVPPIVASATTSSAFQRFGEFVKDQLGKIGIDVRLTITDAATAQSALQRGDFDLGPWQITTGIDDPDVAFEIATTRSKRNWSAVYDPQIDALYDKQSQTLDFDERRKTVQELERQALAAYQVAVILFEDLSFGRLKSLRNVAYQESLWTNQRMENVWLGS